MSRRVHLPEFDYFRGMAILMVLVAHAAVKMDGTGADYFRAVVVGGTNYFLFISGFFFYLIYRPNFSYLPFITKRAKAHCRVKCNASPKAENGANCLQVGSG